MSEFLSDAAMARGQRDAHDLLRSSFLNEITVFTEPKKKKTKKKKPQPQPQPEQLQRKRRESLEKIGVSAERERTLLVERQQGKRAADDPSHEAAARVDGRGRGARQRRASVAFTQRPDRPPPRKVRPRRHSTGDPVTDRLDVSASQWLESHQHEQSAVGCHLNLPGSLFGALVCPPRGPNGRQHRSPSGNHNITPVADLLASAVHSNLRSPAWRQQRREGQAARSTPNDRHTELPQVAPDGCNNGLVFGISCGLTEAASLVTNIMLTDGVWAVSAPLAGNDPVFHLAVGPQNALLCLVMLMIGIATGSFVGRPKFDCSAKCLSDGGFTGVTVTAATSLLGVAAATSQMVGWSAHFGLGMNPWVDCLCMLLVPMRMATLWRALASYGCGHGEAQVTVEQSFDIDHPPCSSGAPKCRRALPV